MKYLYQFTLRCLCLGSLVSLPFGLKATEPKVIEVTFDAKDYQSDKDWKGFIEGLYKTLAEHPDCRAAEETNKEKSVKDKIRFDLTVTNGNVLGTKPPSIFDCFRVGVGNKGEVDLEKCESIVEMFSKVACLRVDTECFSLSFLNYIFPDADEVILRNTKEVTGSPEYCLRSKVNLIIHRLFTLKNNLTWSRFVDCIREELGKYPDDNRVRFYLEFNNGDVFAQDPGNINYGAYLDPKEKPTEIAKILSKVSRLSVDAKHFSTLSLSKVFPWTKVLFLPNAERISGASNSVDLELGSGDWNAIQTMLATYKKSAPHLQVVRAPKVTRIGNAAFFGFKNLKCFNGQGDFPIQERPTIVGTPLPQNYFTRKQSPEKARIAPVTVKKTIYESLWGKDKGKQKTSYKYSGRSVEIGACAFQQCSKLQHVSAHASLIGSAAFAASGLESAHLLLSGEASVGDDVFFNCFKLKECFMMLGRTDDGIVNSFLNGLFWNCFALETVCMPNIRYPHIGQACGAPREIDNPPAAYDKSSLSMFTNCFSLKELDLRSFGKNFTQFLPYWIVRSNHTMILKGKDWETYAEAYLSSDQKPTANDCLEGVWEYVRLCGEASEKPMELLQAPNRRSDFKKYIYKKPYCDLRLIIDFRKYEDVKSGLDKKRLNTWIRTRGFSCNPGETLYNPHWSPGPQALQRFNDAYLQWFVTEDENNEDKLKEDLLNRKTKRTHFVLHGG